VLLGADSRGKHAQGEQHRGRDTHASRGDPDRAAGGEPGTEAGRDAEGCGGSGQALHAHGGEYASLILAMRGTTRGRLAALAALALALAVSSCTEERTLSADGFVADVNDQGVELTLGEPLSTTEEGKELYAVTLEPLPGAEPAGHEEQGQEESHEHQGGGSLGVYDDNAGAEEGMQACRNAADLLCYRAANIVVILEGGGIEAQRLGVAMQKLAEE
jgi:hypothetical protein